MRGRRQRRGSENLRRDVELLHEILVQAALDDDRGLRADCELHDFIRRVRLGGCNCQCAAERDQIMRILDHVMAEAFFIQRAGGKFLIEGHRPRRLVQRRVLFPDFGCERHECSLKSR
jgi:hypothetical protein